MLRKRVYILLAFICLATSLGAKAHSQQCDTYILGLPNGEGSTTKEKIDFLFKYNFASYADEFNEHARPFKYYDFYFLRTPDDNKEYYIKAYGVPFTENGKKQIYYRKFKTAEHHLLLDQEGFLQKMDYAYFEKEVLQFFVEGYLEKGELVFYPKAGTNNLVFEPYKILEMTEDSLQVQLLNSDIVQTLSIRELFYHSVSMHKEYSYLRAFYRGGGEGTVIRYLADFSNLLRDYQFHRLSAHSAERHYIHVTKLPEANTKFELIYNILDTPSAFEPLQKAIDEGMNVYLTGRNSDWIGLTMLKDEDLNIKLSEALGIDAASAKNSMIFTSEADLPTIKHEMVHLEDFTGPVLSEIESTAKELTKDASDHLFWLTLARYMIEYRGHQATYKVLFEQKGAEAAQITINHFKQTYAEQLRRAFAQETKLDQPAKIDYEKITKFLFEYCKPFEGFTIETVLTY